MNCGNEASDHQKDALPMPSRWRGLRRPPPVRVLRTGNGLSMQDDVFRWVISIAVFLALLASVVQVVLLFAIYRLCKAAQNRLLPLMDVITPFIGRTHLFMNES